MLNVENILGSHSEEPCSKQIMFIIYQQLCGVLMFKIGIMVDTQTICQSGVVNLDKSWCLKEPLLILLLSLLSVVPATSKRLFIWVCLECTTPIRRSLKSGNGLSLILGLPHVQILLGLKSNPSRALNNCRQPQGTILMSTLTFTLLLEQVCNILYL